MDTYLFCFDESASASCPNSRLTPRAVIYADSRADARETFQHVIAEAFSGFGRAALRKESKREHRRVADPCESLPSATEYVAGFTGRHPVDVERAWGWR